MLLKTKQLLFFLLIFLLSCKQDNRSEVIIDQTAALQNFNGKEKVLLVSCLKCNCFNEDIPRAYQKDSLFFKSLDVFADTSCSKWGFRVNHLPLQKIDSLGEDIYNVILLRLKDGVYTCRVVSSKEGRQLLEIAQRFFEN